MIENKGLKVALVVVALIAIGAYFFPRAVELLGGSRFPNGLSADSTAPSAGQVRGTSFLATGSFSLGSSGTSLSQINAGTCYLRPYAATQAATSTTNVDCQGTAAWSANGVSALTGVTYGDSCVVALATTTAGTTIGGLHIAGVTASTTQGFIGLNITNLQGTTLTWPTSGSASGTAQYFCFR